MAYRPSKTNSNKKDFLETSFAAAKFTSTSLQSNNSSSQDCYLFCQQKHFNKISQFVVTNIPFHIPYCKIKVGYIFLRLPTVIVRSNILVQQTGVTSMECTATHFCLERENKIGFHSLFLAALATLCLHLVDHDYDYDRK